MKHRFLRPQLHCFAMFSSVDACRAYQAPFKELIFFADSAVAFRWSPLLVRSRFLRSIHESFSFFIALATIASIDADHFWRQPASRLLAVSVIRCKACVAAALKSFSNDRTRQIARTAIVGFDSIQAAPLRLTKAKKLAAPPTDAEACQTRHAICPDVSRIVARCASSNRLPVEASLRYVAAFALN